jgi:hypothetical protein
MGNIKQPQKHAARFAMDAACIVLLWLAATENFDEQWRFLSRVASHFC